MRNSFEIRGNTVAIHVYGGEQMYEALVDLVDLPLVSSITGTWSAHPAPHTCYVGTQFKIANKKTLLRLHRFIVHPLPGFEVDHIDHDGLNNQRSNLRITTHQGNSFNRTGPNRNSTTGFRNVRFMKKSGRFGAHIQIDGLQKSLGRFGTAEEAAAAFDAAFTKSVNISSPK